MLNLIIALIIGFVAVFIILWVLGSAMKRSWEADEKARERKDYHFSGIFLQGFDEYPD